jgi:hypothetical protein
MLSEITCIGTRARPPEFAGDPNRLDLPFRNFISASYEKMGAREQASAVLRCDKDAFY